MRLINADDYEKSIGSMIKPYSDVSHPSDEAKMIAAESIADCIQTLRETPTIDPIHAEGGRYCKECKYLVTKKSYTYKEYVGECGHPNVCVMPKRKETDFCSYGEPKDTQNDG